MAGFFINWTATLITHKNFQFLWGPMTLAVTMEMNCDITHHCHCEGQGPAAIQNEEAMFIINWIASLTLAMTM